MKNDISGTGKMKIAKACGQGWWHGNGLYGPGAFLKLDKEERRAFKHGRRVIRASKQSLFAN